MQTIISLLLSGALVLGISTFAVAEDVASEAAADREPHGAVHQMAEYPPAGANSPDMGRGYQQATPGPGRGSPNYRGGNGDRPEMPAASATDEERYPYPEWQQYPGRRGYGLGYPYAEQGAYPYRGRGAGYGPGRRGYGYGYPGYRGRGGTGYPGHRQYGSPPFYRADETE